MWLVKINPQSVSVGSSLSKKVQCSLNIEKIFRTMALWLESSYVSGTIRNKKEIWYKIIVNNLCAGGTSMGLN